MSSPAFQGLDFSRDSFQRWVNEDELMPVSDSQWEKIREELDGRVANYLDDMIYEVVLDFREGVYDEEATK